MKELLKDRQTIITSTVWLILAVAFLGIYEADIVYNLHLGSFYCNAEYYTEKITTEDGAMMLFARYLAQFFIYPLGASLTLCVVLTMLSLCLAKIADIKPKNIWTAFAPASLALLTIGIVGSNIHAPIRDILVMPSLSLGYIILSIGIAKLLKEKTTFLYIAIALCGIIGFRIGGLTGLFAMLAMTALIGSDKKNTIAISSAATIVISIIMLIIQNENRHWITPISPYGYTGIAVAETITLCLPCLVILGNKLNLLPKKAADFKFTNIIATACMLAIVFLASERHSAFRGECRLTRLMVEEDFKGMVKAADKIDDPNWVCYGLRLIGLAQTDKLEEKMFNYTCQRSAFPVANDFHYPWLNLYAGQPLISLSYAMDYHLAKEENYLNMLVMAYDYILTGEKEGAEKILSKLDDNIVYRDKVKKIRKNYGSHLEFAQKNPVFGKAMLGAFRENVLTGQLPFEKTFRMTKYPTEINARRRALSSLFQKDLEDFKTTMLNIGHIYSGRLPKAYQEAICIMSANGDDTLIKKLPVSQEIGIRTNEMIKKIKNGDDYFKIKKQFGDSYLTYFFFAVDPKRE